MDGLHVGAGGRRPVLKKPESQQAETSRTHVKAFDIFEAALVTGLTLLACWVAIEHHPMGGAAALSCLLGCRAAGAALERNVRTTPEGDRRQLTKEKAPGRE